MILDGITDDGQISDDARSKVNELLKRAFRPEFLNRLDEIVFYRPLSKEVVRGIVELQVADLRKRLEAKQLGLTLTERARDFIIDTAYDPIYGARPLKRFIQSKIETLLARKIIGENLAPDTTITIDVRDGKLIAE